MSADPETTPCPKCAEAIRKDAAVCGYCGTTLEGGAVAKRPPLPDSVAPHRGKRIFNLAVTSELLLLAGGCTLGLAGYTWGDNFLVDLAYAVCGIGSLAFGLFCGVVAAFLAYRDLLGMRTGRVDRAGWRLTMFGGLLAVFSVLMYWLMIGLALRDLL